jgi:hypothetical protein
MGRASTPSPSSLPLTLALSQPPKERGKAGEGILKGKT